MTTTYDDRKTSRRAIGKWGTTARLLVGGFLVGTVVYGTTVGGGRFEPAAWLLGLVAFPAVFLVWQGLRARRHPEPMAILTGPAGHLVTAAVFFVLYFTWWYAPAIGFVSDAALLFYGSTMLIAGLRGYAGCEVLAISNWLLRRNDRVGCLLFGPIDALEQRAA